MVSADLYCNSAKRQGMDFRQSSQKMHAFTPSDEKFLSNGYLSREVLCHTKIEYIPQPLEVQHCRNWTWNKFSIQLKTSPEFIEWTVILVIFSVTKVFNSAWI